MTPGKNDAWNVTVAPEGTEDMGIAIGPFASCADAGAVCAANDEVLSNAVTRTILGPPGLIVADAEVYEAAGATLDFAVTLGRASTSTITVEYATSDETDMNLMMGAVGVRGIAKEAPPEGGLELTITSDAMAVRTTTDAVRASAGGNLAAAQADVTRVRLGLEGTWRGLGSDGGGTLVPRTEVGIRHDAGDAETGFGIDVGGGFTWASPRSGLSGDVNARALIAHEADGLREQGIAGTLRWDPSPESERGFSATITQTAGAQASGGMHALLERGTLEGLSTGDDDGFANQHLRFRIGYGFGVFANRFTATPQAEVALSGNHREFSVGWRLGLSRSSDVSMELGLVGTRRESTSDEGREPEHALMLRGQVRW